MMLFDLEIAGELLKLTLQNQLSGFRCFRLSDLYTQLKDKWAKIPFFFISQMRFAGYLNEMWSHSALLIVQGLTQ